MNETLKTDLRRLLKGRAAFEKSVGILEKWNDRTEFFLGVTVLPVQSTTGRLDYRKAD